MSNMRAKLKITSIDPYKGSETLHFNAVCKNEAYPDDGSDEDNTFARFTPSAALEMHINNPALVGTFKVGQTFYVDFTEVE